MAWRDAYQYLGKIFQSSGKADSAGQQHEEQNRQDAGLPLAARIGSIVHLQQTPLIRAQAMGSLISLLDADEDRIVAISRVQFAMQGNVYRYYLSASEEGVEKFIELYCANEQEITELRYCSRLTRLIPESTEDQQAYTGELGYGLGDRSYTLWRAQLQDMGWSAADLDTVFADQESISYEREAGDAGLDFVAPYRGKETRIDDAQGQHGLQQDIVFMPYGRVLPADQQVHEQLLISTEMIRSVNGDRLQRGIYVDFTIALAIEPERLSIQ